MKRLFHLGGLVCLYFIVGTTKAGIFGPSNAHECMLKYAPKVRLPDALNVLRPACAIGFEANDYDAAVIKVGKCIAKESSDMYSYESTKKIINNCTRAMPEWFAFYDRKLMANINDAAEEVARTQRFNQRRMEDTIRDSQNGPVTIFDANTGTYKYCTKTANQLNCF